jgi:hypothetical protein
MAETGNCFSKSGFTNSQFVRWTLNPRCTSTSGGPAPYVS